MSTALQRALTILALITAIFLIGFLYWLYICFCDDRDRDPDPGKPDDGIGIVGPEIPNDTFVATVDPERTEGAPYPPAEPPDWTSFVPNEKHLAVPPIPEGPQRGTIEPKNPAIALKKDGEEVSQSIDFDDYEEDYDDGFPVTAPAGCRVMSTDRGMPGFQFRSWCCAGRRRHRSSSEASPSALRGSAAPSRSRALETDPRCAPTDRATRPPSCRR